MRHCRLAAVRSVFLAWSLLGLAACNVDFSTGVEARDQWKRTYTLERGGTLEIRNTNGQITVESTDGPGIEVVADRTVRASTDEAAKEALQRFEIAETTTPDHITIDSAKHTLGTMMLSRKVDYRVRLPRWTNVTLDSTNGEIDVTGLAGVLRVETTNGRVRGTGLENTATAETTNGTIALDFNKLGPDGISCDTTNGTIAVTLPRDAKAQLSAQVVNGGISTEGLDLAISEHSRRRIEGSINGGGPRVRLTTVNGAIRVKGR